MKLTTEVQIKILELPDFVTSLIKRQKIFIAIEDLTDEELKTICAEFTEELIKKARRKRKSTLI